MSLKPFSFLSRHEQVRRLQTEVFDLVIIGGGITGAGVARDAASRGMKVALIEAKDFASGTSSRSSKLIHGGIRYLEQMEFHLVFEALSERRLLFEIAPHLVHPIRFILPLYKEGRVGMFKMGLGMWLYDALALFEAPEMHTRLSAQASRDKAPMLRPEGLLGSYVYSDAYMDDDRLVIETLRSANHLGAVCANYVRATGVEMTGAKVSHARVPHEKVSALHAQTSEGETFTIRGRHFVSTVGPWTDQLGSELLSVWNPIMRPSKGIHLTLDRKRLPLNDAVVMAADQERRIIFAIPRHEMVIIGTTDTDYKGDPYDVHSTSEDVDYLLKIVDEYFPGANLSKDDVLASYAGVRPLVHDGSEDESSTSREHLIYSDFRNITFVAGGKYTTYRRMAEDAVEAVLDQLTIEDRVKYHRSSSKVPLNPMATVDTLREAEKMMAFWSREYHLPLQDIEFLTFRHGLETVRLLEYLRHEEYLVKRVTDEKTRWLLEAYHAIDNTMCGHLRDFYLYRVPLFLSQADHGFRFLGELADVFQQRLQWSEEQRQAEIQELHAYLHHEMAWR